MSFKLCTLRCCMQKVACLVVWARFWVLSSSFDFSEVDGKLEDIHELNKPAYKAMHHAEILYGSDDHHCELGLNLNEWQQVFLRMGRAELILCACLCSGGVQDDLTEIMIASLHECVS